MKHQRITGSFMIGGFGGYQQFKADSSVVPEQSKHLFNEYAQIEQLKKINAGVSAGYTYYFNLPINMFLLVGVTPGLGLNFRNITSETLNYNPNDLWEIFYTPISSWVTMV